MGAVFVPTDTTWNHFEHFRRLFVHPCLPMVGYPDGLSGEQIPLGAMVIATCDAFHAMTSDRSYRRAMSHGDAIAELRANSGTQFDPAVVAALVAELS